MNEKNYFEAEYNYIKEIAERYQLTFTEAMEFMKLCVMNRQASAINDIEMRLLEIKCAIGSLS